MKAIYHSYLETPIGWLQISGNDSEIQQISFLDPQLKESAPINKAIEAKNSSSNEITLLCKTQLEEYFALQRQTFDFPMKPVGTEFQQRVWQQLTAISYGRTWSYLDLSKKLGDVKAIRAVGRANGANPISIVIPCHRVIGSNGDLTGYASGIWRKKWLLDFETGQGSLF